MTTQQTNLLFWKDSFLFHASAAVLAELSENGKTVVILDSTLFYPAGGMHITPLIHAPLIHAPFA
jgi:Ser-tRNA(Ala) deacylase AlaX